ncbi:ROK family protein [Virgibacillus ihumii]|uniref:ROK family protein n=1 Tax=Virgibacillus ihumii TaxID=2686091 RepID=UPI00157DC7B4|nr:ROK family protein [Virgibacillus ihumii]
MRYFIALDIGGTNIKYGIVNEYGAMKYQSSIPTEIEYGIGHLYGNVEQVVQLLLNKSYPVTGIGISTTGVVNTDTGEIIHSGETMPGYVGVNWKSRLEKKFQKDVIVENDVNAAALGESWTGAGNDSETFYCMTLGTGIGGAFVMNKRLYRGSNFRTGEIGYTGKQFAEDLNYEQKAAVSVLSNKSVHGSENRALNGKLIFKHAKEGDEYCLSLVEEWMNEAAKGVASIICILDPGLIIIGGAISEQKKFFIERLQKALRIYLPDVFVDGVTIRTAECGNAAGMIGAVYPFVERLPNGSDGNEIYD